MSRAVSGESALTRRRLLGTAAALGLGTMGGCIQQLQNVAGRESPEPVSVAVTTVPNDYDRYAAKIARHLVENLRTVGIGATLEALPPEQLYRTVLLNGNFDIFVGQLPPLEDPDQLRPLFHSLFSGEPGWQNPYRYSNIDIDDLLERQRTTTGQTRREVVGDLLKSIGREQVVTAIGQRETVKAHRQGRFTGWGRDSLESPLAFFRLARTELTAQDEDVTLRVSVTDERVTRNLNPLAAEYREVGTVIGLLYDPLFYETPDGPLPWLTTGADWNSDADGTTLSCTLREGTMWHDGTALTASDVAFTYRFLADTSLGEMEPPVPTTRLRGRSSLVSEVTVVDDRTVEFVFGETARTVARRALTVPVLPEHVWREKARPAEVGDVETSRGVTDALAWSNLDPIGSGPLAFERTARAEALYLRRVDDHFLHQNPPQELVDVVGSGVAFDRLEIRAVPSDEAIIELMAAGELDGTVDPLHPSVIPRIGRERDVQLRLHEDGPVYHLGYNTTVEPLNNPRFRQLVARLVDKKYVASDVFEGYGRAVGSVFDGTSWLPAELSFRDEDPTTPFLGDDGAVDVDAARNAFREQGFLFNEADELVVR